MVRKCRHRGPGFRSPKISRRARRHRRETRLMARPLFSVRLPRDLAEALDRIAEPAGQSRSDVVDMLSQGLDSDDRDMVLNATVAGARTEKRTPHLSSE